MNGNYRKSTKNKKGITMLTLIITIVVGLIIVSAGIVTVSNSISNATITAFANDLNTIQDQVNLYYMQNDSFPVYDGEDAYAQIDITDLASANGNYAEFQEELELNGDWNDNGSLGAFYKIDLSKLNVEKTVRGTKQNSDESDIYVVSYPSMNIYYVKGVEVKSETYFSLSSKIIKFVKNVENTSDDTSNTDVITAGSLTVKKLKKDWTNKLAFTLNAYMNSGESLYVDIGGVQYKFKTNVGNNTFVLNTFDDLENSLSNISSDELYSDDINHWISTDKQILNIYKTGSDSSKIDSLDIDMSNFDGKSPTANNWNIIENNENNILTFKVADTESGVKEVRYEYLQKYGENGNLEKYYVRVDSLDPYFIKSRGKKAILSKDGNVEISLPKEIEGIQLVVIDKAGNISLVEDDSGNKVLPITKGITNSFYIGCTLNAINETGLSFKVAFNINDTAKNGDLKQYTLQVSTDGQNYSSPITKTPTSSANPYYKNIYDYKQGLNIDENIYIKINAISTTNVQKERVVKYSLGDASESYLDDSIIDMISGVPIPKGFVASQVTGENTKSSGLVIYEGTEPVTNENVATVRKTRNQFVWVPVEDFSQFKRESFSSTELSNLYTEPYSGANQEEINEYNQMIESVKKYGGFYIGRYETSDDESGKAQSKKGQTPLSNIKWGNSMTDLTGGAVEKARTLYSDSKFGTVSTLIYGVQWDATIRWLEINYPGISKDSSKYGNYTTSVPFKTGGSEQYKTNNIYDLAGNMAEWTMETYNSVSRVARGGYCNNIGHSGSMYPISSRISFGAPDILNYVGFRLALYIK